MASRRRSVEEKNLKTLRELAALPANKQCFDCHQRGPTYINMTIGSFVCTSCSGILRGLTPPHRVKSITMTTFTPDEIEFLKTRGNEYCRYVWLGTYDSRVNNMENDIKDDLRKRDLMVQKYEKKRWYVDPDIAVKKIQHDQQFQQKPASSMTSNNNNSKQYSHIPEVRPLSQLFGKTPSPLVVENHQPPEKWPHPVSSASASSIMTARNTSQSQGPQKSMDLLAEFMGDNVFSPTSSTQPMTNANGNFANFETAFSDGEKSVSTTTATMPASISLDAYPSFSAVAKDNAFSALPPPPPPPVPISTSSAHASRQQLYQTPADRYAALADLDSHFHQPDSVASPTWTVDSVTTATATSNATNAAPSLFNFVTSENKGSSVFTSAPSNPFGTTTGLWAQSMTNNPSVQASNNPFKNVNESCLPPRQPVQVNQAYTPYPVVGNSPTEDAIRVQFGSVNNFATFNTVDTVAAPPNGFRNGQFFTQNGEFATSPTGSTAWPMPPGTFGTTQVSTAFPATLDKKPNDISQYSSWATNTANPFMVGQGSIGSSVASKPNSSNPFL